MKIFGLIGKKLTHSFSKNYFEAKFYEQNLSGHSYHNFEIDEISQVAFILNKNLIGLNVTIPYKESVITYLDKLDISAQKVGAVNVIQFKNGQKIGFNTDYLAFKNSLLKWIPQVWPHKALILGSGGASKAIQVALQEAKIPFEIVSRQNNIGISYEQANNQIDQNNLIVNTTPLGTFPNIEDAPPINYEGLTTQHYLYDLIYNPSETTFLKFGKKRGAQIKNGLEMLHLQAEFSWNIWHS